MTEEDTFNRLKRVPFNELLARIAENEVLANTKCQSTYHQIWLAELRKLGWTYNEYYDEARHMFNTR